MDAVAAEGILQKKIKTLFETSKTISKLTVHSKFWKNHFPRSNIKILT